MTEPAWHGTVHLRRATRQDAVDILWLEEVCMKSYAEALWGHWHPSHTPESLDLQGHEIIEIDGMTCGCIACEWPADHMRIRKLYLAPNYRRKSIGAWALNLKRHLAAKRGLPTKVSALVTNTDAIRFYQREGFGVVESDAERTLLVHSPKPSQPTS